jgi:hypothetical protein
LAISHKDCPSCGTTVSNYITRCACGYSYENLEEEDPTQRLQATAEEERLYLQYLAARAKQAIAEAAEARANASSDPANDVWATRVEQTEATRAAVMAELHQQKIRNSEIAAAIEEANVNTTKQDSPGFVERRSPQDARSVRTQSTDYPAQIAKAAA